MVQEKMMVLQGRSSASSLKYWACELHCLSSCVRRPEHRYYRVMNLLSLYRTLKDTWLAKVQLQENLAQSCIIEVKKDRWGLFLSVGWKWDIPSTKCNTAALLGKNINGKGNMKKLNCCAKISVWSLKSTTCPMCTLWRIRDLLPGKSLCDTRDVLKEEWICFSERSS